MPQRPSAPAPQRPSARGSAAGSGGSGGPPRHATPDPAAAAGGSRSQQTASPAAAECIDRGAVPGRGGRAPLNQPPAGSQLQCDCAPGVRDTLARTPPKQTDAQATSGPAIAARSRPEPSRPSATPPVAAHGGRSPARPKASPRAAPPGADHLSPERSCEPVPRWTGAASPWRSRWRSADARCSVRNKGDRRTAARHSPRPPAPQPSLPLRRRRRR
jgi:hypothetical protein